MWRSHSRIGLVLKGSALCLCVGFVLSNHPPVHSQAPATLVDVRQDQEIEGVKLSTATQGSAVSKLQDTVISQGQDIARLDTKATIFFGLLGLLQGGGLALHIRNSQK